VRGTLPGDSSNLNTILTSGLLKCLERAEDLMSSPKPKYRQSNPEYVAAHPDSGKGIGSFGMQMGQVYLCKRCQTSFRKSQEMPDARLAGFGICTRCIAVVPGAVVGDECSPHS
jgi:hypothetical protein